MPSRAEPIKENEKKKHALLPAQMPASRVSRNPGGNNRQEQEGRSVSPTRRETSSGQRVGKTTKKKEMEKQGEKQPFKENQSAWHSNVKAPADTTWQISPLCHLL